jgi:hypothetical protein
MKKLLIGCGVILVLCVLLCMGVFGFGYYKAITVQNDWQSSAKALTDTNVKRPYQNPSDQVLTRERLERYFAVRDFMAAEFNADPFVAKVMAASKTGKPADIGGFEVIGMVTTFPPKMMRTLAEELERQQSSVAEYIGTGQLIFLTIYRGHETGHPEMVAIHDELVKIFEGLNVTIDQANQNAQSGNKLSPVDLDTTAAELDTLLQFPAGNYELLTPFKDKLVEFAQLTFFELLILNETADRGLDLSAILPAMPVPVEPTASAP